MCFVDGSSAGAVALGKRAGLYQELCCCAAGLISWQTKTCDPKHAQHPKSQIWRRACLYQNIFIRYSDIHLHPWICPTRSRQYCNANHRAKQAKIRLRSGTGTMHAARDRRRTLHARSTGHGSQGGGGNLRIAQFHAVFTSPGGSSS